MIGNLMFRIQTLFMIFILNAASSNLHSQVNIPEYKAIQFGISESRVPTNRKAFALRFLYVGDGMIPYLNHQIGLNHSSSVLGGSIVYTYFFVNGGVGFSNRWLTLNGFIGPSIVINSYRSDPSESDAVGGSIEFGIGANASASAIVKLIKEIGLGIEIYTNRSTTGSAWGTAFVLHLSNTK